MATRPAHCGHDSDVPPMSYQPVLQGASPQRSPLLPSGGSVRYTSAPVRELACSPMSGTPRLSAIGVLPAGSDTWYAGVSNTWLKPPPAAIHATSAAPA